MGNFYVRWCWRWRNAPIFDCLYFWDVYTPHWLGLGKGWFVVLNHYRCILCSPSRFSYIFMTLERDQVCLAGTQGSIDLPINPLTWSLSLTNKKQKKNPWHVRYFWNLGQCIGSVYWLVSLGTVGFLVFCSLLPFVHGWHPLDAFSMNLLLNIKLQRINLVNH